MHFTASASAIVTVNPSGRAVEATSQSSAVSKAEMPIRAPTVAILGTVTYPRVR